MTRVLFLCSSNRYRSRFAEHLFNWLVRRDGLHCRAISRGLSVGRWWSSGPISMRAVEGMKARGVPVPGINRCPQQVCEADLAWADLIVALQESEHRAAIENLFPRWANHVEYWHIGGQDNASREPGLSLLENQVWALVARLHTKARGIHHEQPELLPLRLE